MAFSSDSDTKQRAAREERNVQLLMDLREGRELERMPNQSLEDFELLEGVMELNTNQSFEEDSYNVEDLKMMTLLKAEGICEQTFLLSVRTVWYIIDHRSN